MASTLVAGVQRDGRAGPHLSYRPLATLDALIFDHSRAGLAADKIKSVRLRLILVGHVNFVEWRWPVICADLSAQKDESMRPDS